eukprot:scaffold4404_cov383-Prasinococcus_capsulatus_cf.AAC.7
MWSFLYIAVLAASVSPAEGAITSLSQLYDEVANGESQKVCANCAMRPSRRTLLPWLHAYVLKFLTRLASSRTETTNPSRWCCPTTSRR